MYYLVSTRFNNITWNENVEYRKKRNHTGCIYCSPQRMTEKIDPNSLVFVVEMNNSLNKIEGIGLIKNTPNYDKYYNVYEDRTYNVHIFKSNYRIDRNELIESNKEIVEILDYILFKEKTHMKRGAGLTTISEKLLNHDKCKNKKIKEIIREIFINYFNKNQINETLI